MNDELYTETLELEITEEEHAELKAAAQRLLLDTNRYMISLALKGYALASSIEAEEMYHISPNATEDQIMNSQIDSTINQVIFAIQSYEKLTHELGHFTPLELIQKRLGADIKGCTTFSDWLFREARKRGSKLN